MVLPCVAMLAACARPGLHYAVAISPDFTADQATAVLAGVDQWTVAVPELKLEIKIAACGSEDICISVNHEPMPANPPQELGKEHFSGGKVELYVDRIYGLGWAFPEPSARLLQQVAAHEMGHALGIEHHISVGNLMTLYTDEQSPTITSADIDAFDDVR
jgi:hypothetical protein